MEIGKVKIFFDGTAGVLKGEGVSHSERRLGDLEGVFRDTHAWERMNRETLVYAVETHGVAENIPGGLLLGISRIYPGKTGDEYFMTKGHFHALREKAEYYWGIAGEGILLLMDEARQIKAEAVSPGSLHYISGNVAHRLINTGNKELIVGACWPSDAGHDYVSIKKNGFAARVIEKDGQPVVILD